MDQSKDQKSNEGKVTYVCSNPACGATLTANLSEVGSRKACTSCGSVSRVPLPRVSLSRKKSSTARRSDADVSEQARRAYAKPVVQQDDKAEIDTDGRKVQPATATTSPQSSESPSQGNSPPSEQGLPNADSTIPTMEGSRGIETTEREPIPPGGPHKSMGAQTPAFAGTSAHAPTKHPRISAAASSPSRPKLNPAIGGALALVLGIGSYLITSTILTSSASISFPQPTKSIPSIEPRAQIELIIRRMEASDRTYDEISQLELTRSEALAANMSDTVASIDRRVAELHSEATQDYEFSLEAMDLLVEVASTNRSDFDDAASSLAADARSQAKLVTAERILKIGSIIDDSINQKMIDDDVFSSFWNKEVQNTP